MRINIVTTYILVAVGALLGFIFIADLVSALDEKLLYTLIAGAFVAILLSTQPIALLWLTTLLALVIAGMTKYFFPSLGHIWWLTYGAAFLMVFPAIVYTMRLTHEGPPQRSVLLIISLSVFFLVALSSTILAWSNSAQIVVGIKSLFLFSGVWIFFAFVNLLEGTVKRWLKGLLFIGAFQWLPAIYQYIFVRADRISAKIGTVSAADSVVGTFGGSTVSGGLSAVLALFLVSCIIFLFAMKRQQLLKNKHLILLLIVLSIPLLLMEVKVFFFYLPLGFIILFRKEIVLKPAAFIGGGVILILLLVGALFAYQALHWSAGGTGLKDSLSKSFSYSFAKEPGYQGTISGALTRRGTLEFWWKNHELENLTELFIGHGLGASRTQGQVLGQAAQRYAPHNIDRTGMSIMLWDFGVLGTLSLLGISAAFFLKAGKLCEDQRLLTWQRALANGLHAVLPLFVVSTLYRNDIPYAAPMMFLIMAAFGLITWLSKQAQNAAS